MNRFNPSSGGSARASGFARTSSRSVLLGVASVAAGAVLVVGCLPSASRGSPSGGGSPASTSPGPSVVPAASGPTPRLTIIPPTPTPAPTFLVHTVRAGESLNTIAHRYGTTARSLAFWNRSTYPSLDPDSPTYRPGLVKIGWTLFVIPNDIVNEDDIPGPEPSDDGADEDPADESAIPE